jgi:hypothetical protein
VLYLKLSDGVPKAYSLGQLLRDNPDKSFPESPSDALLADLNVYPYTIQAQPTFDHMTQVIASTGFSQIDGAWIKGWEVNNLSTEDAGRNIRLHRDSLLQETDWMALNDNTMSPAWASYRQALRDVTSQEGFPFSVTWPTKPE